MKKILSVLFLSIAFCVLIACIKVPTQQKLVNCPLPQKQNCVPQKWNGTSLDTSRTYRKVAQSWYVFERVKQVNSPADEWFLSFIDDNSAILTFSDKDRQRMMFVKMLRENKASMQSGVGLPLRGSIGGVSVVGNHVIFATKEDKIIPIDDEYTGLDSMVEVSEGIVANSDLYEASIQGNFFNGVNKLEENLSYNNFSWESHPSLSPKGDVLFFASNRPYKHQGTEIWFSIRMDDGVWSKPINCGDNINTDCDEITPFVSKNGEELYFASSGHQSIGGYDIFVSEISPSFWKLAKNKNIASLENSRTIFSEAKNLRGPLNTIADELFPSSPGDCDSLLYYSSNQDEETSMVQMKGGFDIYVRYKIVPSELDDYQTEDAIVEIDLQVDEPQDIFQIDDPEIAIAKFFKMQGTVRNRETKEFIPYADLTIRQTDATESEKSEEMKLRSDDQGKYKVWLTKGVEYEITAEANKYFYDTHKVQVDDVDTTSVINQDFLLPQMFQLRVNFPTDIYDDPYRFVLDSNGVETTQTWQDAIEKLAQNILRYKTQIKKVLLTGHTDDVASVVYNKTLGKNRVNFVIDQLVENGVPRNMLEGRSAGELEPLENRSDESLEMFRKRLRRVTLQKTL